MKNIDLLLPEVEKTLKKFNTLGLSQLDLPIIQSVDVDNQEVPFIEMGDTQNAHTVVVSIPPYFTPMDKSHYLLRLAAQQEVLGEGFSVVGVQAFDPKQQPVDHFARKLLAKGDFSPLSKRILSVIESLQLGDDQKLILYGYSMGADVAAQTAYNMVTDENSGIRSIETVGVFEPARMTNRGLPLVRACGALAAFGASGKDFYKNILRSESVGLLEAFNIDPSDQKAEKIFMSETTKDLAAYLLVRNRLGHLAIGNGFGTDKTLEQLLALPIKDPSIVRVVGRMMESKIVSPQNMIDLAKSGAHTYIGSGDHSRADHLASSAAFMLSTVRAA